MAAKPPSTWLQHWMQPAATAMLGLITGVVLASFNSGLSTNRFFLEKQAKTADDIAVEFSAYVVNWDRLMQMRRNIDAGKTAPDREQAAYFKKAVYDRAAARARLFSALDSMHLYYSDDAATLAGEFKNWDNRQAALTIDRLPDIGEWRAWQIKLLRQLRKEIAP